MMRIALTYLLVLLPGLLQAHEVETHYNRVSLSASASEEVQQDELQATLYAVSEDKAAKNSANEVSARIHKALALLTQERGISSQTGSFNTQPVYHKQQIVGWRSRQSITVKSTDAAKLSELLGQLQSHVQVEHVGYGISDVARAKAEDRLIRMGIDHFKTRARLVTNEMGSQDYRLVNMNVGTSSQGPIIHRSMAMAERVSADVAPPLKTGTQRVEVSISGMIEIQLK